jgi:DNA-binding HxlR family transcriptional regulator
MEKLNLFFAQIKDISWWQRLFRWRKIRTLSFDAYEEFRNLARELDNGRKNMDELRNRVTEISTRNESLTQKISELEQQSVRKETQSEELNSRIRELTGTGNELNRKISHFEATKEERVKEYNDNITRLNQTKESLEAERKRLNDDRVREAEERFENMKKQWAEHEADVKNSILRICELNQVRYVEKVPFRGSPDNTIEISGEFIIFDAKSPANDDLRNFPLYIKAQTENLKKYASQESVKKSIFLVVPTNIIHVLKQLTYRMGDYDVFVITRDSLEPVILSLKKIEEYDLAEKLSPDDRDSICRIIGKFAHTAKRRIQVDQFFSDEFIDIVMKSQKDLPEDLQKQVIEFEKSEKLNPPTEKRAKLISIDELQRKSDELKSETEIRKLSLPENNND